MKNRFTKFLCLFIACFAMGMTAVAQCTNGSAFGSGVAPTTPSSPVTLTGCAYAGEYSTITSVVAGSNYTVIGTGGAGNYLTVRHTTVGGTVVVFGNSPLTFTAPVSGTYYLHFNTNSSCGTDATCHTGTITLNPTGCTNTSSFGTVAAPTTPATPTTISGCSFQSEYSTITGCAVGGNYTFTGSIAGTFITVHQGTSNGPIIGSGVTPLTVTTAAGGTYYPHWNTNSACGTASTCMTTTITLNVPPPVFCIASTNAGTITGYTGTFQVKPSVAAGAAYYWSTTLTAGVPYTFSNCPSEGGTASDTYFRIYNTSNTIVASADDICGANPSLTYTPTVTGTYYVHLAQYSCGALSTSQVIAYSAVLPFTPCIASTNAGTITGYTSTFQAKPSVASGAAHYWSTTLTSGVTYTFSNCPSEGGTASDTYLRIYDGASTILATADDICGANPTLAYTPTVTGTYYVHLAQFSCNALATTQILSFKDNSCLAPAAPTSVTTSSGIICAGASVNLNATSAGNTIRWYTVASGGTNIGTSASAANFVAAPASTTIYYAEAFIACGAASATRTSVSVNVNPVPAAPTGVTATASTICSGASTNLNATSAGNTINWYTVASGGTSLGTTASGANFAQMPSTTTTYYAEAIGVGSGSQTFNFTGSAQTFTVPMGVTSLTIDVSGAQGGLAFPIIAGPGGNGGRATGSITVTGGQVLNLFVGGMGGNGSTAAAGLGGFNGGALGALSAGSYGGGGGGGASDIRISPYALANRVVIAGGGGGAAFNYSVAGYDRGGMGGALTGEAGYSNNIAGNAGYPGGGGTQAAGGVAGVYAGFCNGTAGLLGLGGAAGTCANSGGGGGGGYYGGGGGVWSGGGGGSNFLSGGTHTQGFKAGNGQIILSWTGAAGCPSTSRTSVLVTVNPTPSAPTPVTASPTTVCPGSATSLTGTSTGNTISWYTVASGGTSLGTSASGAGFSTTPPTNGANTYYAEALTAASCVSTTRTSVVVTRQDITPPTITWGGGNQTVNLGASCTATVPSYTASASVTAADNCSSGGSLVITQSPVAGSTLSGAGATTITLTATDAAANTAMATFTLTRVDATAPTFTWGGGNQTINLNASCAAVMPTYTSSGFISKSDNCSSGAAIVITQSPTAGSALSGTGVTAVTLTATDAAGNTTTAMFNLTRQDVTAPTISWTGGTQTINLGAGCTAVMPDYTASPSITKADGCTAVPTVTQSPAAGSTLTGVGATTVTLTAADASGNMTPTTFTLNRVDVGVPTISWTGGPQSINLNASCAATMPDYTASPSITKADGCTAVPTVTQSPAAGSALSATGAVTVTLTATDASGNIASTTFTLDKMDVTVPTVSWTGGAQSINLDASCAAVMPDYTASASITTADNCTALPTITQSPAAGSALSGVGATTVTLTATDASTNSAMTTFTLNRLDVTNPVAIAPSNMTVNADLGSCGAIVNFSVSATDNCSGSTAISSPVSGTNFPIGTTTVLVVANDGSNNQGFASFDVVVVDNQAPMIMGTPANITVSNGVGMCGAVVTWTAATVMDNCTGSTISPSMASGSTFPIGTTAVIYTATDASGNITTSTFNVVVNDTELPVITVPGAQTVNLDNMCQAIMPNLVAMSSATDNCAGSVITQSPAAGSTITGSAPVTVTITATDASMNIASNTVTITPNTAVPSVAVGGPTTFCDGGSVTLFAPISGSYTYQWFKDGSMVSGATLDSAVASASGSYHVEITITGACTMVSAPTAVTELAIPAAPMVSITTPVGATSPVTICDGTVVTLAYSGASPAQEFVWYTNGALVNYTLTPSSTYSSGGLLTGSNTLSLAVVYTGGPTCLSAPASVTVIKNPLPVATITPSGPTTFCANIPTTLNASPNSGGYTYLWKRSTVTLPSVTASYTPTVSGNHRVLVTDAAGCTGPSPWMAINIKPLPTANAGADKTLCVGTSVQIGSAYNAANTYAWTPATALSSTSVSNPMSSATTNMQYIVTVTNLSSTCVKSDTMQLTSLAQPATPSLAIQGMVGASSATACEGTSIILVPTATGTANLWHKNNVLTTVKLPGVTTVLSAPNAVADVYTIKTRDANNCVSLPSNAISALINASPIPSISPAGTSGVISLCLAGMPTASQLLTANTPMGAPSATFVWQQYISATYNNVGTGNTYTSTVGSAAGQGTKTYRLIATYSNACVRNSSNKTVKVQPGCKGGNGKDDASDLIEINTDSDVMSAYPNPTTGVLNVDIENSTATEGKLVLYNALGQIVVERTILLENGKASEMLDLSQVAIGVYTLSFQTNDGQKVQKVVKE